MKDGGAAFPQVHHTHGGGQIVLGMSLRDVFAAVALMGYCANPRVEEASEHIAIAAFRHADAMLAERAKQ